MSGQASQGASTVASAVQEPSPAKGRKRKAALWLVSLVGAGVLGWMASSRLPLWPQRWIVPRVGWLVVALLAYLPYAWIRAERIRRLLEAELPEGQRLPTGVVQGSGWVSFLAVMALPFRLGEFSRPILLARVGYTGLDFTAALSAQAFERILDGLSIVALLFAGLALSHAGLAQAADTNLAQVRELGLWMTLLFCVALVVLLLASRAPGQLAKLIGFVVPGSFGDRLAAIGERVAESLRPLWRPAVGLPVLLQSVLYWAITVAQLWAMARAFGLDLSVAASAAVVAIVGLSIQLPGGPAQLGSFQLGMTGALVLYLSLEGPEQVIAASGFSAAMYLMQLLGALALAIPGLWWLRRAAAVPPVEPSPPDHA